MSRVSVSVTNKDAEKINLDLDIEYIPAEPDLGIEASYDIYAVYQGENELSEEFIKENFYDCNELEVLLFDELDLNREESKLDKCI